MKLAYNQIESFARNFNPAQRAVLIYGPDHGLVQERAAELLARVLPNPDDPFALLDMPGDKIKEDPALLFDEVSAIGFFGGRKVIRIREEPEKAAEALKSLLSSPPAGKPEELGFVLVLADDLAPKSALRSLFEGLPEVAALPCYHDEGAGIANLIREEFRKRQIRAEQDVLMYLSGVLKGDRMMVRMEMEKIDLFLGAARELTLAEARLCTGDLAESSLDEVTDSVGIGNLAEAEKHLHKALNQGIVPIALLRSLSRHFQRLAQVVAQIDSGTGPDQAIKQLRPPVFFKQEPAFKRQLSLWNNSTKIRRALNLLYQAELRIKTSAIGPELVTTRALSVLCKLAGNYRN